MSDAERLQLEIATALAMLHEACKILDNAVEEEQIPYIDKTDEMPVNLHPSHRGFVEAFPGKDMWPLRSLSIHQDSVHRLF